MNKTKSFAKMLVALLVAMFAFTCFAPVQASAFSNGTQGGSNSGGQTTGDINDIGASMEDGELTFEGDLAQNNANQDTMFSQIMDRYKGFIVGVAGIGTITMIAVFIMNFAKLGTSSGNPQERQKVIHGLVFSGLAAAGLGSVTTFVALFYYILR